MRARTARCCVLVSSVVCDWFVAAAGLLGCIRVVGVRSPTEYLRTYLDLYASVRIAVSCWRSDWVGIKRGVKKRSCYHSLNNCDQIQTQTACRAGEPNPKSENHSKRPQNGASQSTKRWPFSILNDPDGECKTAIVRGRWHENEQVRVRVSGDTKARANMRAREGGLGEGRCTGACSCRRQVAVLLWLEFSRSL